MARPRLELDANLIEKLASVGCTNESIAIQVGCSVDTLERRYAGVIRKGKENMKTSLRTWQLNAARKGNAALLIWLGKQLLGQRDNIDVEATVKDNTIVLAYAKDGSHLKKEEDKKDE